jgi:hypothetical protein
MKSKHLLTIMGATALLTQPLLATERLFPTSDKPARNNVYPQTQI